MNGKKAKAIRRAVYRDGSKRNPGKYVSYRDKEGKLKGEAAQGKFVKPYGQIYCGEARRKYQALKKVVKMRGGMVDGDLAARLVGRPVGGRRKGGVVRLLRRAADRFEAAGMRLAEKVGRPGGAKEGGMAVQAVDSRDIAAG
jgi:hypothetical protein